MRYLIVLLLISIVHSFNVSKWENDIVGFHSYCHIPSEGVFDLSASTNCIMDGDLNLTNPLTVTCTKCSTPIFIKTASNSIYMNHNLSFYNVTFWVNSETTVHWKNNTYYFESITYNSARQKYFTNETWHQYDPKLDKPTTPGIK